MADAVKLRSLTRSERRMLAVKLNDRTLRVASIGDIEWSPRWRGAAGGRGGRPEWVAT
jgi:hypothetical protein